MNEPTSECLVPPACDYSGVVSVSSGAHDELLARLRHHPHSNSNSALPAASAESDGDRLGLGLMGTRGFSSSAVSARAYLHPKKLYQRHSQSSLLESSPANSASNLSASSTSTTLAAAGAFEIERDAHASAGAAPLPHNMSHGARRSNNAPMQLASSGSFSKTFAPQNSGSASAAPPSEEQRISHQVVRQRLQEYVIKKMSENQQAVGRQRSTTSGMGSSTSSSVTTTPSANASVQPTPVAVPKAVVPGPAFSMGPSHGPHQPHGPMAMPPQMALPPALAAMQQHISPDILAAMQAHFVQQMSAAAAAAAAATAQANGSSQPPPQSGEASGANSIWPFNLMQMGALANIDQQDPAAAQMQAQFLAAAAAQMANHDDYPLRKTSSEPNLKVRNLLRQKVI